MTRALAVAGLTVGVAACLTVDERPNVQAGALGQAAGDSSACGAVTYQGCCDGPLLYYCNSGVVLVMDCSQSPLCGWDAAASFYDCKTAGLPDPSGTHPKACTAVPDIALPKNDTSSCGSVTWEGCCHGELLHWCEAGALKSADCSSNPSCGWHAPFSYYNCGTDGSADPTGAQPKACAFDAAVPDLGLALPCGKVTYQGCCDGETLKRCSSGKLIVTDCANSPLCGWQASSAVYKCSTNGGADPSGTHPKACAVLLDASPPDGLVACGNVTSKGCCHGELLYYCSGNTLQVFDCHRNASCGWDAPFSHYDCATDGSADPSGAHPQACDFGDAGPPPIGNNCGSLAWQGCCDGTTLYYCYAGTLKWVDCGNMPYCGWKTKGPYSFYDCNTDGQADPTGQLPKACPADAGVADAALRDAAPDCGPVTHQGCCEGDTLYWCEAGALKSMDCAKSPTCGWQDAFGYYDCDTDGAADPLGAHPRACSFDGGAPVLDKGQPRDARPPRDEPISDTVSGHAPTGDSGCGCALVPRSPGSVILLLMLLLIGVTLRRRSG